MHRKKVKIILLITGILSSTWMSLSYADNVDPTVMHAISKGAQTWANNCARCHNYRAPTEFSAEQWRAIMLHMRIQCGLTGEEERNVYAFLTSQSTNGQGVTNPSQTSESNSSIATKNTTKRSTQKNSQPTSNETGKVIYHQTCIACHGANGKGTIPGAPDFTSNKGPLNKSDEILLKHIENGYQNPGSPTAMPPKGGNPKLTTDDLKQVLKYMRNHYESK